jgi:hypothetical protein
MEYGPISNNNGFATEPRLVGEYADYMTYDNSLWGDDNWRLENPAFKTPERMTAWLERNTLYTYKRDVLGMPTQDKCLERTVTGNLQINHHTKTYGSFYIKQANGAWQYKSVTRLFNKSLIVNLGWLLDDESQKLALFMLSIRLK